MKKILSLIVTASMAIATIGSTGLMTPILSASSNNNTKTEAQIEMEKAAEVMSTANVSITANTGSASSAAFIAINNSADAELIVLAVGANKKVSFDVDTADVAKYNNIEVAAKTGTEKVVAVLGGCDVELMVDDTKVAEAAAPLPILLKVAVSKEQADNYDVVVLREHNGVVEVLDAYVLDGGVKCFSNKFSSYAVALLPKGSWYKVENTGETSGTTGTTVETGKIDNVPKTGSQLPLVLLGLTALSAVGCVLTFKKKEN